MPSKYQNLNPLQWSSRCCNFPDNLGPRAQLTAFCSWNKQVYFTIPRVGVFSQQPWSLPCSVSHEGKKLNFCFVLANSIKVTAGCLLTCSDTSAWGSSLEVPGQGSFHAGELYQGLGQGPARSEVPGWRLHPPCDSCTCRLVRSEQCWGVTNARLKAAWNKPVPEWCQIPPVCDTGASLCLPYLDGLSSAGTLPTWGYLQDLSALLDHLLLWAWCLLSAEFTWIWPHFKELGQSPQAIQCNFLRKQNKKQVLAFLAGPEVVKVISDMLKVFSVCLCIRNAKSCFASVAFPFKSSSCSPVEVSVAPAAFWGTNSSMLWAILK